MCHGFIRSMKTRGGTYCVLLWFFSRALEWQVAARKNEKSTNNFVPAKKSFFVVRSIHLLEIPRKPLKTGRVKAAQCYKWYPPAAAAALLLIKTYAFLLRKQPFFASMVRVEWCCLLISKEKEEVEAELADDRDESQTIWHVTSKPLIITVVVTTFYLLGMAYM